MSSQGLHNVAGLIVIVRNDEDDRVPDMARRVLRVIADGIVALDTQIAGERIRDKIAASKKKGMWMGGNVPLGYDVKDRKLLISEPDASTVRLIFRRYAELGSVTLLRAELDQLGIVSKRAGGRLAGGQHFSRGALYLMAGILLS